MRVGSLFAGYGGSDLAVASIWPDATPAWFVEYDKHPSAVLAAHWPDVPNYGDITAVDWSTVEPVDILTAGWPCQPFSHAGQRRGTDDDRHLWPYVADAVRVLRPRYLIGENVAGHLVPWDSTPSSPTLPPWGSMRGGELYERPTPVRLTVARDCSSSQLLPTSRATDGDKGGPNQVNGRGVRDSLPGLAPTLLPTPTAQMTGGTPERHLESKPGRTQVTELNLIVENGLLETGGELTREAPRLLPTPKATNNDNQQNLDRYGPNLGMALMPELFEWTSAPTDPPSPDGNTSWDDQPLPLPSLDGTTDPD